MKTRVKCFIDSYRVDEKNIIENAIKLANDTVSAPKFGIEDVVTKYYYLAVNLGKIYVVVSNKDKIVLGRDNLTNALLFDGHSYIQTKQSPSFDREEDFTISASIVTDCKKDHWRGIFGKGEATVLQHEYYLNQKGKDLRFRYTSGETDKAIEIVAENVLSSTEVNHINLVYNAKNTTASLYVNNKKVASALSIKPHRNRANLPLMIGNCYSSSWDYSKTAFRGEILKCSIHKKALSKKERFSMMKGINIIDDKVLIYDFNSANPRTQSLGDVEIIGKVPRVVSRIDTSILNNVESNVLAITDIKNYPLERMPAEIVEYIELVIKPEYNLSDKEIKNAGQALLEQKISEVFPHKLPVLKIVNYGTSSLDTLMLPNMLDDTFACHGGVCLKGDAKKGQIILDEINRYEAKNTQVVTGVHLELGDAVASNGNYINELRFYDINQDEIKYKVPSASYYKTKDTFGVSHLTDGQTKIEKYKNVAFFYNGEESQNIVIKFEKPAVIGRAFIVYGGSDRTPKTLKIVDSNGVVRFEKAEKDGNIRKAVHEFTFIG